MVDGRDIIQPADPKEYGAPSLTELSPQAELALRQFAREALDSHSAEPFLDGMVRLLWAEFDTSIVFVSDVNPEGDRATARIVFRDGLSAEKFSYDLAGTPCENVVRPVRACVYTHDVQQKFPDDLDLVKEGAEGYGGIPLFSRDGRHIGVLAAITRAPIEDPGALSATLRFFAPKAALELERILAEESGSSASGAIDEASAKVDGELTEALHLYESADS